MARYWVGTSGWSYANWRGSFYPPGTKQGDWLAFYARHLRSVEINATFYRLPRVALPAGWHANTPADFLFAIKAWRTITHFKRLRACEAALADWADWPGANMVAGRDIHVFFDNTDEADHAVRDALRLERLLGVAADGW